MANKPLQRTADPLTTNLSLMRKFGMLPRALFLSLPLFLALPIAAQRPTWFVLAREDGCIELARLVKPERLRRAPVSPEDFAQMMRERGESVVVGPPANLPAELAGKVVQVKVGSSKAPVFVQDEVCRNISK